MFLHHCRNEINTMKKRLYHLLSVSKRVGDASWYFDLFIIALIVFNVIAIVLESVEPIRLRFHGEFAVFEFFSVSVFSIEYVLRVWTANLNPRFRKPVLGNLRYAFTPMAIIDLLAIFPFFLPFLGVDLRSLRVLRIFRMFRLFKIARYMSSLSSINRVFKNRKEDLVVSMVFTVFLLLVASTVMYYAENEAQPEVFSSIPATMWWGIATLTTVGYGDIYPVTPIGKFLGGLIAVLGIGLVALPTGILASGFSEELSRGRAKTGTCPTCGQPVDGKDLTDS
jgi:voltage-gated potassium channel